MMSNSTGDDENWRLGGAPDVGSWHFADLLYGASKSALGDNAVVEQESGAAGKD
jgi:hypothetical protein